MSNTANNDFNYQNRNYPPENDTTSEGGYGAPTNTFSAQNQRRADSDSQQFSPSNHGLLDQSLDGGPLNREIQDAKQGSDGRTRAQFAHEARRDFDAMNPYGRNPDNTEEAGERLASAYADQRGRQYEGSGSAGNDGDVGAL
ncbi:hypothetical protein C8Q80DRAFT_1253839 [Daedaleopsis nitida]|nr:hypothetical protein C8Q80DRAFT_1253839 [Daedaleopsis nitida]